MSKINFYTTILFATFCIAFSASGYSSQASKVELCHVQSKKQPQIISVSKNALQAHLGHGDLIVGVDVDEFCEPLSISFCVFGVYPPFDNELHDAEYFPTTGALIGQGFTFAGTLEGTITPAGSPESSIFAEGSVYEFVFMYDGLESETWYGSGESGDDTGLFVGDWQWDSDLSGNDDGGPADYYFIEGNCSCDIPGYTGPCPE